MPLTLSAMPHPAEPRRTVPVFTDPQRAAAHLRDHLLTAPEAEAWALVAPAYANLLDPADADARFRYWAEAEATGGTSAQPSTTFTAPPLPPTPPTPPGCAGG